MTKPIRYNRPFLELEFDQQALTQPGCCRFVQVVVRLCGVPAKQNVMLTVSFDRVRKYDHHGTPLDDYEQHPTHTPFARKNFPNYEEYATELLARAHEQETETIRISMTSQSSSLLSQAEYRLDSREAKPIQRECKGFRGVRLLSHIRAPQDRDALQGQYPAFVASSEMPLEGKESAADQLTTLHMVPLFPQE